MNDEKLKLFGLASLRPGLQYAADLIAEALGENQQRILDIRDQIEHGLAKAAVKTVAEVTAKLLPEKRKRGGGSQREYWEQFTPEQRSAEMKRRMLVRLGQAKPIGRTETSQEKRRRKDRERRQAQRDAAKAAKVSRGTKIGKAQKSAWANYTPKQRKARIEKTAAAWRAKHEAAKAQQLQVVA